MNFNYKYRIKKLLKISNNMRSQRKDEIQVLESEENLDEDSRDIKDNELGQVNQGPP